MAMKVHGACKHYEKMYQYYGEQYALAHDPCTIYYLLFPNNLQGRDAHVEVELAGNSRGRTNCTFMHLSKAANAHMCEKINVQHFW